MYIAVSFDWIKACGKRRYGTLGTTPDGVLFKVIKADDFGSRGKMYKVEIPRGEWIVWSLRGIVEYSDEEIEMWN